MPIRKQSSPFQAFDRLQGFAFFVCAVEEGSLSAAARKLGVTPSAVSKRVGTLESAFGLPLLQRTTRRIALTDAGMQLYERCVRILRDVRETEDMIGTLNDHPRGRLMIAGPVIFGEMHIAPVLPSFMMRYPDVQVDLSLSDRFVDLLSERIDVAVRIGRLEDSSLLALQLAKNRMVVCCSPSYLEHHPEPEAPDDLLRHNCLLYTVAGRQNDWLFRIEGSDHAVPVTGSLRLDHGGALREAAIGGLGIARLPYFIVADALRRGTLRPLLEDFGPAPSGIYAMYPRLAKQSAKVRAFISFLHEEIPRRLT
ncbi:MAG TPA: LysR family transcriptional regulator [Polyangiaceae bacterium]|nr:LysR family transcriptional regulator [Polyangiaceae bacterium]